MEALAAKQLEKKKKVKEQQQKLSPKAQQDVNEDGKIVMTQVERDELNIAFGFPKPPTQAFAVGKEEAAAVWWGYGKDAIDLLLGWRIERFRKDKSRNGVEGNWQYKGYSDYMGLKQTQAIVEGLTNEWEYRFSVRAINEKGLSAESIVSNGVMIEKPLPAGWFRFYHPEKKLHYYANLKINRSYWSRPELDPFFLDEQILINFEWREIKHLKKLYLEEIDHFGCVSVKQFMDILREVGEKCSQRWIIQLFRGYAHNEEKLDSWVNFMEIFAHIKRTRKKAGNPAFQFISWLSILFGRARVKLILNPFRNKLGDWKIEFSQLAERNYYHNVVTGEHCWSMPQQVKFYIPPALESTLLKVFDYGQLEDFKQYFSLLDIDGSGDLSKKEVQLLLKELQVEVEEEKFDHLFLSIDLNGNGTLEFDEFCWMMYQLYRKDGGQSDAWKDLTKSKNSDDDNSFIGEDDDRRDYSLGPQITFQRVKSALRLVGSTKKIDSPNKRGGISRENSFISIKSDDKKKSNSSSSKSIFLNFGRKSASVSVDDGDDSQSHYSSQSKSRQVSFREKNKSKSPKNKSKSISNSKSDDYDDYEEADNSSASQKPHPKHCLCGCRSF
eukprot:gene7792-10586_t